MKRRIGIMQGRLSPRPPGKLQEFPHLGWQEEFEAAARIGFDAIEWIYELDRAERNPLVSAEGRRAIRAQIERTGVTVRSVCGDYFMLRRLAGDGPAAVAANCEELERVIGWAREIGAERILLPLLESAAIDTPELAEEVTLSLQRVAPAAAAAGIVLGLEMELPGPQYHELIRRVAHPNVRAYYDAGNSTAQGFDIEQDVKPLLPELYAVHIKDRKRGGSSQFLGRGDANFRGFFKVLNTAGFCGDLVLQHYFEQDPAGDAARALAFVRELWPAQGGAA